MVNTSGLVRRSTYEEVAMEVELDRFKDLVKLPVRTAKFILEAPSLQQLLSQFQIRWLVHIHA